MKNISPADLPADPHYTRLKNFIIDSTGLVYFKDKDNDLCYRLLRRFEILSVFDCGRYFELLTQGPSAVAEFDLLTTELTIGETYFFRHTEQFDALKATIFPDIIAKNQFVKSLRVWCAGCSIGAEPYSIAIQLQEEFSQALEGWDVRIIGTDINREFLTRATTGVFDEWAFRGTDAQLRSRHFDRIGKSWAVKPKVKNWVRFSHHNLMPSKESSNNPALTYGALDLIICRNVMIYFDSVTVAKIIPRFEESLVTGGWMVIGHAEQPHGATHLELVQLPKVSVYKKTATPTAAVFIPTSFQPIQFTPIEKYQSVQPALQNIAPSKTSSPLQTQSAVGATSLSNLAYLRRLADAGQFDLALDQCAQLLKTNANNPVVLYYRALVFEQLGRDKEAEQSLLQAVQLDHAFVMAQYYLGRFYEERNNSAKGTKHLKRALDLLNDISDATLLPEADDISAAELKTVISSRLKAA